MVMVMAIFRIIVIIQNMMRQQHFQTYCNQHLLLISFYNYKCLNRVRSVGIYEREGNILVLSQIVISREAVRSDSTGLFASLKHPTKDELRKR